MENVENWSEFAKQYNTRKAIHHNTIICISSTCETRTLILPSQDFQDSPKHSGNASQPLPEQSTMQLAKDNMGGILRWPWPLHHARLNVALCIPNAAMCCS